MNIASSDLKLRLDGGDALQIIDVRSPGEFASGHIPGAVNLPLEQVDSRLDDLRPNQPTILVCQSGNRAEMCLRRIHRHRDDLIVLEGGTDAWVQAGFPVVKSTATSWSIERQVRLMAGLLILLGAIGSIALAPGWIYLSMFVGAGLTFAGLTNVCGMASLFAIMPWNRPTPVSEGASS